MEQAVTTEQAHVLIILNPMAGNCTPEEVRRILDETLGSQGWNCTIYETTGEDDIAEQIATARQQGCDLVVAAGGDGTVSEVAHHLVQSGIPLGILPVGTANVLALELGIPKDVAEAAKLLTDNYLVRELDAMRIGERHFVLRVGIGIDSLMMQNTGQRAKRLFGRLAYLATLIGSMVGYRSRRFTLLIDGKRSRPRAWEVIIANAATIGSAAFHLGPQIEPSDGMLDLCVFKVRSPLDYLRLLQQLLSGDAHRGPNISYIPVRRQAIITTDPPLPVQADGDVIGETPVQIDVVPRAIRVVVPPDAEPVSSLSVAQEASKDDA